MTRPYIPHNGERCPVKPDTLVDIRFRDGSEWYQVRAGDWSGKDGALAPWIDYWKHTNPEFRWNIIGWRLSFPQRRTIWQRISSIFKRKDTQ